MMKKMFPIVCIAVLCLSSASAPADENDYLRPIGRPREARAQRRQGGEAFPPLPLPVTPLRRSEKKRPPSPSALIGKVVWGSYLDYTGPDGMTQRLFDWNMVPADAQQLLRQAITTLKLSPRAYDRILKVARTIADLEGAAQIGAQHLLEAVTYRLAEW